MKKFKLTGFARFFIIMLILAPAAYIGASYANGEDGIENIKNVFQKLFGSEDKSSDTTKEVDIPNPDQSTDSMDDLDSNEKIQELMRRNQQLEEELKAKDEELKSVKAQLEAIKSAIGSD